MHQKFSCAIRPACQYTIGVRGILLDCGPEIMREIRAIRKVRERNGQHGTYGLREIIEALEGYRFQLCCSVGLRRTVRDGSQDVLWGAVPNIVEGCQEVEFFTECVGSLDNGQACPRILFVLGWKRNYGPVDGWEFTQLSTFFRWANEQEKMGFPVGSPELSAVHALLSL